MMLYPCYSRLVTADLILAPHVFIPRILMGSAVIFHKVELKENYSVHCNVDFFKIGDMLIYFNSITD